MPGKGQAEIALILGLLAIALVVGIYSYSALTPPTVRQSALTQEQKSVAVFAEDMIRDATLDTVSTMYRNGGYLDVSESGLGFLESDSFGKVAYWQMCENAEFPHVESELERGIREYINEYLSDSVSMSGKPALFSKAAMQVEADVQEDRVEVSVNLPTVFEGVAIEQPYEVTVSTKLGRVTDFSRNFAIMQADLRVLDSHLIKSLQQSSEYSSCWIPYGMGSAWGTHSLSWKDLKDCMESHIKYSLSNTQIGREIPVTEDGKIASFHYRGWSGTAMEFFFVPAINVYDPLTGSVTGSDRYEDLRISFFFGDDDGLNKSDFSAPDHLEIKQNEGAFMRFLRAANLKAAEYSQVYSVKYPVVVNVWDSSARKSLRFATYVYIEENDIGTGCTTPPAISQVQQSEESGTYGDRCLSGATEDAMVTVKYRDTGLPVENARVGYGGCDLGITNELGEVWGRIWQAPFSALTVSVDGNVYAECYNYEEMKGILMEVPTVGNFKFKFMKVPVTKGVNTYSIGTPVPLESDEIATAELLREVDICDTGVNYIMNIDDNGDVAAELFVSQLPIDEYEVSVWLRESGSLMGFANTTSFTPSGSEIYVYVPSLPGFDSEGSDIGLEMENLQSLYGSCGLSPVSVTEYSGGNCQWTAQEGS